MSAIFDALPGIEVPVAEINQRLSALWSDTAASGGIAPSADDAKATQVNFVLHLGFKTTSEDATKQFQTTVRFSQRYPSRIVVLCPVADEAHSGLEMRSKIYGECFLGKSKSDKRCVEFVLLSYPRAARRFLEDQVSICLSTDLPLYYWAHRFSESGKLADYQFLLTRANRVMIDSAVAPEGAMTYTWPRPETVRDLAFARLLPVRQSIGQFLASYAPEQLAGTLREVAVSHPAALKAEARALLRWLRGRLRDCGAADTVAFNVTQVDQPPARLGISFAYDDPAKQFRWSGDLATKQALFEASYGGATTKLPAAVSLLRPENALSEAMFF
ncbi:MAG TPA: glucose-6-phosphate dehydrogenase assembly protein OpcA [Opitutaceae bacterium]|nr:glucose-6-phosphate dehydrogenase assembly protein OpcA [Opitutaceae bacterium]